MALEYGFTEKEKATYYLPNRVYSSFGRDVDDDFIALYVYDEDNEELLDTIFLESEEIGLDSGENFIDINIAEHLRNAGFVEGNYNVTYKFLRRLAGVEREVFVDDKGVIWNSKVQEKKINDDIRYFTSTPNPKNDEFDKLPEKELFKRSLNYVIDDISPDKTELIVERDEIIKNSEYIDDFKSMSELIEYKPLRINNSGKIKFDQSDQYVLEFDINDMDRGFTQNMVGGEVIIPKLYQIENETTTNEDVIVEEIVEVDFFEPEPDDKDTLQQRLDEGDASDFRELSNNDLIDILRNDESESERELADAALQERANEQR
jgi:hypothetical protein